MTHYIDAAMKVPELPKRDMIKFLYGGLKHLFPRRFGLKKLLRDLPHSSIKGAFVALYGDGSSDKAIEILGLVNEPQTEPEIVVASPANDPFKSYAADVPDFCSDCGARIWKGQKSCSLCGAGLQPCY